MLTNYGDIENHAVLLGIKIMQVTHVINHLSNNKNEMQITTH